MSNISAVIAVTTAKVKSICAENKGKLIPNLCKFDDIVGFNLQVTEADLNFRISSFAYPVEDKGPGHFLLVISSCFLNAIVPKDGYYFEQVPTGPVFEYRAAIYAEDEQELTDGIFHNIDLEIENILCRMLQ